MFAAGEVPDLMFIAEQDVDEAGIDHAHPPSRRSADAQAFRQGEGDRAPRLMRDGRLRAWLLRGRSGPQR